MVDTSPIIRWQHRVNLADKVLDIPSALDDLITENSIKQMKSWIKARSDKYLPTYVVMYHSTGRCVPVLEQGLLPTSKGTRRNVQSESGYVYLATTPLRAKMFGDLHNESNSVVYEVIVPLRKLLPDNNILNSKYLNYSFSRKSLADSLCFGGAKIKGNIEKWQIQEYRENFIEEKEKAMNMTFTKEFINSFRRKLMKEDMELIEANPSGNVNYNIMKDNVRIGFLSGVSFLRPNKPELAHSQNIANEIFQNVRETEQVYKNAKNLTYEGLTDYKEISTYNKSLLAAKRNTNDEIEFVTWSIDSDRKGVHAGNYFDTNYKGAKEDFSIRSGLMDSNKLFDEAELQSLYKSTVFRGRNDDSLTYEEEVVLRTLLDKIEAIAPERVENSTDKSFDMEMEYE